MPGKIITVVGAQWGSEAKGLAVETLTKIGKVDIAVRTGALNAGHTVYKDGKPFAMQTLPCSWIDPKVVLVLGAGAYLNQEILDRELAWLHEGHGAGNPINPILLDIRSGSHTDEHKAMEAGYHERMGSTGKGCSAALTTRIARNKAVHKLFNQVGVFNPGDGIQFADTERYLNDQYDLGKKILLEGTQGTFLDFYLGEWPYVTARQTHASAWLTEAGLSPNLDQFVVLVARTWPIRVAGNSGPMPGEVSWPDLARHFAHHGKALITEATLRRFEEMELAVEGAWGMPTKPAHLYTAEEREEWSTQLVDLHKEVLTRLETEMPGTMDELKKLFELTTVTKKLRRIAKIDRDLMTRSIKINRPNVVFLNFLNYEFPEVAGMTSWEELPDAAKVYIDQFENTYGTPVGWVSTSATTVIQNPAHADLINAI